MSEIRNYQHVSAKRFWVNIWAGPSRGNWKNIYHRRDLPFEVLCKWQWYFEYRAALYKVSNPKHKVELTTGSYEFVPPIEEEQKRLKNVITGKKATITKYENLLKKAIETWNQLFPIEDDLHYKKCVLKIDKLKCELRELEKIFD
jgi:hypothetical protein